jgi:phage terminase small subunit
MSPSQRTLCPVAGLSPKHARFVAEYAKDLNGKQAAIRAGYSARSAEVTASRLLSNAKVAAAVEATTRKQLAKAEVTGERIAAELARYAFASGDDTLDCEPRDRLKALELLGKKEKLFTERHEHSFADLTDEQLESRYRELVAR